jgi:hypothetical protein
MLDVIHLCLQLTLSLLGPACIIRRDLTHLAPDRLARAWNDASLWAAVAAFGPLSLLVHFARTRRTVRGGLVGLCWAFVVLAVAALLGLMRELMASGAMRGE